ncbi:PAS domain S-box-containing protein/diguanylate cyclase (GGDEF) domain-containing protein [Rhizobium sp. NFR07]|uniref:bifunctional diguanylate cyclase/phosphodiesterase n=1 Tax=Rhizobium sp. NFR07 TaxID=1566262 RepID=UPI0008EFD4C5|nr:EAL domain-containing protein [Rhizobium sp. NFR07]SFB45606.1 PAS domain S-box-containing protein/diguanylate cyclase (GGDEF) domain-containing protein [Rhizobium sp. NFR07]
MAFYTSSAAPGAPATKSFGISYFLPAIVVVVAVSLAVVQADREQHEQFLSEQRLVASEKLAQVSSRLETQIHGNVNLVHGLVAAIAASPEMSQPQFAALSERIFSVPSQLRNVVAAPNLVVRLIYPLEENKALIGHDYAAHPKQSGSVMEAIKRRKTMIAGPVKLDQGGSGLLVRYPVFKLSNGHFWGIVSSVIDADRLYRDSNLNAERQPLDIAISRRPTPEPKDVFVGNPAVFSEDAVHTRIELGYDTWYLSAVPKGGWIETPPSIAIFRLYAALIAVGIVAPMIWAGLLMKQRHRTLVTLQQREEELGAISHRLGLALEASGIGVWEYDPDSGNLLWDRRMKEMYGAEKDRSTFGFDDWRNAIHPEDLEAAQEGFRQTLAEDVPYVTQFRVVSKDGDVRYIRANGRVYRSASRQMKVVGANWDVTNDMMLQSELSEARQRAEEQNDQLRATRRTLEHQSLHDSLTGLPNRRFLDQFMDAENTEDANHRLAFIHVDLDRFKEVNDTLGHAAGDEVLRQTTERLLKLIGHDEFASRVGGDEFVVVTSGPQAWRRSRELALAIVRSLAKPIEIDGHKCRVGCSAGIACQTAATEDPRQLLVNADIALYEAKKRGRNRMEVFSEELRMAAVRRKNTSDEFLTALEHDQIVPFFQPQFDALTLDIVGVEALARWEHPERGILAPDKFLDIAESLNRAADLDAIMLDKAFFQSNRWQALGLDVPHLSVNISAQRLKDGRLMDKLAGMNFRPGSLSFELLESISFDGNDDELRLAASRLKSLGVDIEIDDFGTGHASIVSLLELGPKRLKIDRKLIAPLEASASQRRLVASIIEIGKSQNIEILAEGVETPAHIEILRNLGCHALQGYAFAKPMSAEAFVDFAREWQNRNRLGSAVA